VAAHGRGAGARPAALESTATRAVGSTRAGRASRKVVYLTFDDGPLAATTPRLLRALRQHNAKATFFMVGNRAASQRALVRRVAREGHAIGNHTYWHPFLTRVPAWRVRDELARTTRAIGPAAGRCMRPPYGDINRAVRAEALRQGLTPVLWSYDTYDWRRPGVDALVQRFTRGTRPGAIILAHDVHPGTVAAVERMLPRWREMGYTLRALPACRR
jgi:peptidoglycan/xylan/chitin deacetylase (PgdA/CDA1 family)